MRRASRRLLAFLCALVLSTGAAAAPPLTTSCDASFAWGEIWVQFRNPTIAQEFAWIVADPSRDRTVFERLWQPRAFRLGYDNGVLVYESPQDAAEITRAILADATLRERGIMSASPNMRAMDFGVRPPKPKVTVTEYHNRILDHYFLSSSAGENAAIESGAAGPGWERTGESFVTTIPEYVFDTYRVFRFYGPGPNSHFFTVDPLECGHLRNRDPGWIFEGDAFGAARPVNGTCPTGTQPVYRLYNNRWMHDDSNHRFVTRRELYDAMVARGWVGEGLAFCASP